MDDDRKMQVFQLQAELCKSLADPKRLMIIHELRDGAKSVGELAENLNLKQSNTSQHLAVLRKAGVIVPHRQGNTVHYSLVTPKIATACDMVREVIAEQLQRNQSLTGVI
ncbi:MAG: winged helix-turn-helix transcriptional regulator [Dehalococcoidia bacterium]|nr:winged helix-turn-helix transcriptional regulator [Dehalococcoidia bacterium]